MNGPVVTVRDLRKVYGQVVAVDGISFEVERGEIFGLLGPNGAGKTSTLETLEGLRFPDGGSLQIMGIDSTREARRLRGLVGVQLQTSGMPDSIRVGEAMELFCAYHNVKTSYEALGRLGLKEQMRTQYYMLSAGQKRRLALAVAIAHNPSVLFLDEPTAGLDVASRAELHRIMRELRESGATLMLATHDMAEAEKMTDRVAILLRGRIVATGTPRELTATGSGLTKVSVRTGASCLSDPGITLPAVTRRIAKEDYAIYYSTDPGPTVLAIIDYLKEKKDTLVDLRVERPSLEERFLELTERGGEE